MRASMQKVASTQSSYTDGEPPISGRKESFSKKTKRQVSTQESVGGDMPLPDGLLDRLKASNWSERDDGVTELEEFVSTYPRALAPHLHKVSGWVWMGVSRHVCVCVRACELVCMCILSLV